jgi:uncharacterized protein YciI
MFIAFLKLSKDRARARELMSDHQAWIERGLEEGGFILVGGLEPQRGGVILAHGCSREAFEARLREDPFVAQGVVEAEVFEVRARQVDPRLEFLLAEPE